jgi:hypothetical protein
MGIQEIIAGGLFLLALTFMGLRIRKSIMKKGAGCENCEISGNIKTKVKK